MIETLTAFFQATVPDATSTVWASIGFGALGGVANCILVLGGFPAPSVIQRDQRKVLDPGFIGPLILGAIAALATFLLGTSQLPQTNQWGIALISGLGGGNVLSSLLQRQQTSTLEVQVNKMNRVLETLAKEE